jgi:hypothetical protein
VITASQRASVAEAFSLLPAKMRTEEALVMVYAIGLQESEYRYRRQMVGDPPKPIGPAKGYYQFERGGGCRGVVTHAASRYWMHDICGRRGIDFNATAIWNASENDDVLAAAAARLLLFTDPRKLPVLGDEKAAWNLYMRVWRPGKSHPEKWPKNYAAALLLIV